MNKTGTKTLGECFRIFGLETKSFDYDLFLEFKKGNLKEIFKVSDQYDGFEDWPWPLLYRECSQRYPDAKFILTLRKDPETWFDSLCRHSLRTEHGIVRKMVYNHTMPQKFKAEHIQIYNNHLKNVSDFFCGCRNNLLTVCWENGDGWKQIAPFLGFPIPIMPFPHLNQGATSSNDLL